MNDWMFYWVEARMMCHPLWDFWRERKLLAELTKHQHGGPNLGLLRENLKDMLCLHNLCGMVEEETTEDANV